MPNRHLKSIHKKFSHQLGVIPIPLIIGAILVITAAAASIPVSYIINQTSQDTRSRASGESCDWCAGADQCYASTGRAPLTGPLDICGGLPCCMGYTPPSSGGGGGDGGTCTVGDRKPCGTDGCSANRQKICQAGNPNYWGPCVNSTACGYTGGGVGTACSLDSHCAQGLTCSDGKCKKTTDVSCLRDSDCASGYCDPIAGTCQAEPKKAGADCAQDSDCNRAKGYQCVNNTCQIPKPTSTPPPCGSGLDCVPSTKTLAGSFQCLSAGGNIVNCCPAGQTHDGNTCVSAIASDRQKTELIDCATLCPDVDGCICKTDNNCITPGNGSIIKGQNCGVKLNPPNDATFTLATEGQSVLSPNSCRYPQYATYDQEKSHEEGKSYYICHDRPVDACPNESSESPLYHCRGEEETSTQYTVCFYSETGQFLSSSTGNCPAGWQCQAGKCVSPSTDTPTSTSSPSSTAAPATPAPIPTPPPQSPPLTNTLTPKPAQTPSSDISTPLPGYTPTGHSQTVSTPTTNTPKGPYTLNNEELKQYCIETQGGDEFVAAPFKDGWHCVMISGTSNTRYNEASAVEVEPANACTHFGYDRGIAYNSFDQYIIICNPNQ